MKHRQIATTALVATLGTALVLLTGCSKSGAGDSARTLAIGGTATVKANADNKQQVAVSVTVTGIEAGTSADLRELENSSQYSGKTPYYLRYRIAATQSGDSDVLEDFVAYAGAEQLTQLDVMPSLDVTGDPNNPLTSHGFSKCEPADTAKLKNAAAGQSLDGCVIYLADGGVGAPTKVQWGTPPTIWKP
ncbi:hypothetical protein ACFZB9_19075 [Kitasatospora sp. NPDC008050]|uniref:hypothetical protein n=1 Tax=Kitasatospora sp. NPDC008050 TaxID=3364021 RepID=UPI0036EA773F